MIRSFRSSDGVSVKVDLEANKAFVVLPPQSMVEITAQINSSVTRFPSGTWTGWIEMFSSKADIMFHFEVHSGQRRIFLEFRRRGDGNRCQGLTEESAVAPVAALA